MEMSMETQVNSGRERGFALILALLALMLLTFLGLTLATTTSTELQIATNFRWSQQAYYNAEAGIEAAKVILRDVPDLPAPNNGWNSVLPVAAPNAAARAPWQSYAGSAVNPAIKCGPPPYGTGACGAAPVPGAGRNWEGVDCDTKSGTGYGVVLAGGANPFTQAGGAATGAYENVTSFRGQPIAGAFTLWVRRDLTSDPANITNQIMDDPDPTSLILTSEGVAPTPSNVGGALQLSARAVRVLQVKLTRALITNPCQAAEGQTGGTAAGSNFGACAPLAAGSVDSALGGGAPVAENAGVK
jgi:hypothetical protein